MADTASSPVARALVELACAYVNARRIGRLQQDLTRHLDRVERLLTEHFPDALSEEFGHDG